VLSMMGRGEVTRAPARAAASGGGHACSACIVRSFAPWSCTAETTAAYSARPSFTFHIQLPPGSTCAKKTHRGRISEALSNSAKARSSEDSDPAERTRGVSYFVQMTQQQQGTEAVWRTRELLWLAASAASATAT
jgi:hypothetical protein